MPGASDLGDERAGPAVRLAGVTCVYPRGILRRRAAAPALAGVDLELARGATLALTGPNGSGKSTLLRLVAGLARPTSGAVEVLGGAPTEAAVARRVGYAAEDVAFPPELGGRRCLALAAELAGLASPGRAAERWLARVGLEGAASRALREYSRGMLRRFGLAAALLGEPELLVLDEPTSGLDVAGHAVLDGLLDEARARGAAILVAAHAPADLWGRGAEWARASALVVLVEGRAVARAAQGQLDLARGLVELELEGATPNVLEALGRVADGGGARIVGVRPSGRALLALTREAAERARS